MSNELRLNQQTFVPLEACKVALSHCPYQEHVYWDKELIISWKLPNNHTVYGRSAVVYPENFNRDIGFNLCMEMAAKELQKLEGYVLSNAISKGESGVLEIDS